jgi:hypothetical protein
MHAWAGLRAQPTIPMSRVNLFAYGEHNTEDNCHATAILIVSCIIPDKELDNVLNLLACTWHYKTMVNGCNLLGGNELLNWTPLLNLGHTLLAH